MTRKEQDDVIIKELSEKYHMDVSQFLSDSPLYVDFMDKPKVWDEDKINTYLKRCPFCGGKAHIVDYEYSDGMTYAIECENCKALSGEHDERPGAIANWNNRYNAEVS